ncbi:MAG: hypothetical protein KDB41_07345, partial [Propionibacteriaceae bacterium]|nr:hypothetical protein [Propionibacteriaceae bacterium]
ELLAAGGLYASLAAQQMEAARIDGVAPVDHPDRRADKAPRPEPADAMPAAFAGLFTPPDAGWPGL